MSSSAPDGANAERGPLGKTDAPGSCAGDPGEPSFCGGQSDGPCWCDDLCVGYGDCCADVEMVCNASDDDGDDGDDGDDSCLSSAACGDGEYCAFESGCGEGPVGACEETPDVCPAVVAPVCGCNGQSYSNSCQAAAAGISVQSNGLCPGDAPEPTCEGSCGGQSEGCWCDELCSQYGDCCDDYEDECVEPDEPEDPCEALVEAFVDESESIRACSNDAQCGQVLEGTSCGCTRNWVARTNVNISDWEEIRAEAEAEGCALPGMISTCDCPPALGYACNEGVCSWDYL